MDQAKKRFLLNAALSASQAAAFQRSNVYSKNASQIERGRFIELFRVKLTELEKVYAGGVSEENHVKNIIRFKNELSAAFPHVLTNGTLLLGVAQKAVNIYVKYLWILGYIPPPPHCPVDRIVLKNVGITNINWTTLDNENGYRSIIETIRTEAKRGGQTIPEWELITWNNSVT